MLLTSATNFSLARFLGKVPSLTKPLQATGPMVAPMAIAASGDAVSAEPKLVKTQATNNDVDQVDKGVSDNLGGTIHIAEANVKENANQEVQVNQLQNLLEQQPWIRDRLSEFQAKTFGDPENIPLFRELDFA